MKKYVKASHLDDSGDRGNLSEAIMKLQDVQSICGYLEDFYFGEDLVSEFTKAYQFATKALAALDRADAKLR